ncbi:MAG: hypothetical protein ACK4NY_24105 [Spirosomataceae bacterium]
MSNKYQNFINSINPRKLFLFDGLGAIYSAFMLGFVLFQNEILFGIPKTVLFYLSIMAATFAVYSLTCYIGNPRKPKNYLRVIAFANLTYCCISLGIMTYFFQQITVLGIIYLILEKFVVLGLVFFELMAANQFND